MNDFEKLREALSGDDIFRQASAEELSQRDLNPTHIRIVKDIYREIESGELTDESDPIFIPKGTELIWDAEDELWTSDDLGFEVYYSDFQDHPSWYENLDAVEEAVEDDLKEKVPKKNKASKLFQPADDEEIRGRGLDPDNLPEDDTEMDAVDIVVEEVGAAFRIFKQGSVSHSDLRNQLEGISADEAEGVDGTELANLLRVMMELHPTEWTYWDIDAIQRAFQVMVPIGRRPNEH